MYIVTIDNNILHDPRIKDYQVLNPVLNLEVNKTHSFSFTIYPTNPMFNSIERLKSIIEVYDDGELIFRGRTLNDTADFDKATTIQCEGELAYLNDSTMEPYSYFGNLRGLLELYIDNHNAQVDVSKQFTLGTVDVTGDFVRSNIEYTNTWEELSTKTFGSGMGGYLRLRRENDINYIDYLADSTYISGQTIELSKNLLDYEKTVKANDIVTVLIPLGAKLQDEEGNETDERLTIESVNAGSKFIEHTSGIAKYGRIVGYKVWDDINSPSLLKTRATTDLNFLVNLGISIKIKAIDLNILDKSIPKIRFFEYVKIISKPHEIDDSMLIKKQTIHLDDPSQNTIEVGVEVSSFTDKQLEANNTIKKINADYVTNEKIANVVNPLNIQISTILQESNSIKLSVERLNSKTDNLLFDSILINANGELGGYQDWKDFAINDGIIFFDELKFLENMTFATLFEILKDDSVLGGEKLSFFGNGKQEYGLRPIVGEYEYSYRAKRVKGTQPRTVEINEYDSNQVYLRKRSFIFDGTDTYEDIPNLSFSSDVKFISITYIISGVSVSNRLEIAETMFAIGEPKPYVKSADSVTTWARSEIKQLADEISLKVDSVDSKITNTTVKITAKDGVEIWNNNGRGLTVYDDNNEPSIELNSSGHLIAREATIGGEINATSGKVAGFEMVGNSLVSENLTLRPTGIIDLGEVEMLSFYDTTFPNRDALTFSPTREEQHLVVTVGGTVSERAINSELHVFGSNESNLLIGDTTGRFKKSNLFLGGTDRVFLQVSDGSSAIRIGKTNANDPLALEAAYMKSGDTFYVRKSEIVNGKRRLVYEEP